jgi:O-antigen/teichoic acid export membrane protein
MSRTSRFLSGMGFGYTTQILTMLIGLWLTPFLLFRVGQHDYGLWLVSTQIMFYLGLLDLGIVALLPREVAFATGRAGSIQNAVDLPHLIGETVRMVLGQLPFVILGALIAWLMIPADWAALSNPIGLVLVAFVITFPLRIFSAVVHGLQDYTYAGSLGLFSYVVSTGVTILLVVAGLGLYALALGWLVLQLINALASWHRLRKHFPGVLPQSLPRLSWERARIRLKQGFWVSINQIAVVLLTGTDMLIIGKLFGPAAVVPYACTGKLISVLANQPQMLMAAAGPALSQMRTGESRERLSQVCVALGQAMLMLSGAVVCVVLLVNQGFVGRWVGAGQYGGFWLTLLILLSMLLRHWNLTVGYTLFCFGYERRLCLTALLDGLVSVTAVVLFVWLYGLAGAPLGMIVGVCLVSLPLNLSALAHDSGTSLWALVRPLSSWFVRFVVLMLGAGALARVWMPGTVLLLALTAAAGALVYAAVMFPLALRYPLGLYVRPRLFPLRTRMMRALRLGTSA